jgi:broad specificity phosphatase PhoE
MRKLILIKHSKPVVNPDLPSDRWELGEEGQGRASRLAEVLRPYALTEIVSSGEPKAKQTADVLAETLGISCRTKDGLREHDRRNVPHMDSREFISAIAQFFRQPRRLVLGEETAEQAFRRFADAVDDVIEGSGQGPGDVAIVSHGTVISLFAYRRAQEDPFQLWRRMGLPSLIAFELPSYEVASIVDQVT